MLFRGLNKAVSTIIIFLTIDFPAIGEEIITFHDCVVSTDLISDKRCHELFEDAEYCDIKDYELSEETFWLHFYESNETRRYALALRDPVSKSYKPLNKCVDLKDNDICNVESQEGNDFQLYVLSDMYWEPRDDGCAAQVIEWPLPKLCNRCNMQSCNEKETESSWKEASVEQALAALTPQTRLECCLYEAPADIEKSGAEDPEQRMRKVQKAEYNQSVFTITSDGEKFDCMKKMIDDSSPLEQGNKAANDAFCFFSRNNQHRSFNVSCFRPNSQSSSSTIYITFAVLGAFFFVLFSFFGLVIAYKKIFTSYKEDKKEISKSVVCQETESFIFDRTRSENNNEHVDKIIHGGEITALVRLQRSFPTEKNGLARENLCGRNKTVEPTRAAGTENNDTPTEGFSDPTISVATSRVLRFPSSVFLESDTLTDVAEIHEEYTRKYRSEVSINSNISDRAQKTTTTSSDAKVQQLGEPFGSVSSVEIGIEEKPEMHEGCVCAPHAAEFKSSDDDAPKTVSLTIAHDFVEDLGVSSRFTLPINSGMHDSPEEICDTHLTHQSCVASKVSDFVRNDMPFASTCDAIEQVRVRSCDSGVHETEESYLLMPSSVEDGVEMSELSRSTLPCDGTHDAIGQVGVCCYSPVSDDSGMHDPEEADPLNLSDKAGEVEISDYTKKYFLL